MSSSSSKKHLVDTSRSTKPKPSLDLLSRRRATKDDCQHLPLGRFGAPDEIAKAMVFLACDDSSYVTGTELFVDGGFAQI